MAAGYENRERICTSNSEPGRICVPYRDFIRPEQLNIDKAQLLPNEPEYKNLLWSSLLPSAPSTNEKLIKNFKKYGSKRHELEKLMFCYPQFNGFITSEDLKRDLKKGGHLVSIEIGSQEWAHVCGLMVLPNGREWFDSTVSRPHDEHMYIEINKVKLQHDRNMTCGPHACFFLINRFLGRGFKDIVKLYPSENGGSLDDNDSMVNNGFNQALSALQDFSEIAENSEEFCDNE